VAHATLWLCVRLGRLEECARNMCLRCSHRDAVTRSQNQYDPSRMHCSQQLAEWHRQVGIVHCCELLVASDVPLHSVCLYATPSVTIAADGACSYYVLQSWEPILVITTCSGLATPFAGAAHGMHAIASRLAISALQTSDLDFAPLSASRT
jgi:hypothetical protein